VVKVQRKRDSIASQLVIVDATRFRTATTRQEAKSAFSDRLGVSASFSQGPQSKVENH
jgi:hypothetical protein